MLTLGRKPGEYIVIDGRIVITVEYDEGLSRVSIDAPKDMEIMRGGSLGTGIPAPGLSEQTKAEKEKTTLILSAALLNGSGQGSGSK